MADEYQAYFNIKRAAIGSEECCGEGESHVMGEIAVVKPANHEAGNITLNKIIMDKSG